MTVIGPTLCVRNERTTEEPTRRSVVTSYALLWFDLFQYRRVERGCLVFRSEHLVEVMLKPSQARDYDYLRGAMCANVGEDWLGCQRDSLVIS